MGRRIQSRQAERGARTAPASRGTLLLCAAVALGSALGGSARWVASIGAHEWLGAAFPWGTLFVNVTGSFLIGLYAALTGPDGRWLASPNQRQFFMAGFCGGYTTFSIFSLETLRLLQAARLELVAVNIGFSMLGSLAAVWAGYALALRVNQLRR
jgi:fluoride exporter